MKTFLKKLWGMRVNILILWGIIFFASILDMEKNASIVFKYFIYDGLFSICIGMLALIGYGGLFDKKNKDK